MKKIKKYLSKKEYIIFALSLIIILLSTFSFAFYYNVENTEENIVTSECFKLTFQDENDINLDKAYPLSDSEGSNLKPYTFTIRNVCDRAGDYQINIETLNSSTLSTNYLKYKLDNQTPSILGNQLEVLEYINNNVSESRNIKTNLILPNEEVTYNLRLWIDEESTFEQTSEKEYSGKVVVKTVENKAPYQTIVLNTNGGEISNNEIIRVKTRSIGDIPTPTKEGYTFEGWYSDEELTNKIDNNTIVTNEINNLYAKYTANKYTITFNTNGGTGSLNNQTLTYDTPQNLNSASLTKTDYTFAGWTRTNGNAVEYKNGSQVSNLTSENNGKVTLYAVWVKNVTNYSYSGTYKNYKTLASGVYKIELWGAQGGNAKYTTQYSGGYGAYVSGNISLGANKTLYFYVGGMGTSHNGTTTDSQTANGNGYNGGNTGIFYSSNSNGGGGGGATDVRLVNGNWDYFNSLKSRIMVAAGGGGADSHVNSPSWSGNGGAGGGLTGYDCDKKGSCYAYGEGGLQNRGGQSIACSSSYSTVNSSGFGLGGKGLHSGGGSGYYGGGAGNHTSAAGGSSFISGHSGCNAISESSTASNIIHTNKANHYSGYKFTSTLMIDGQGYKWTSTKGSRQQMPNPSGGSYASGVGRSGNGYARITLVSLS